MAKAKQCDVCERKFSLSDWSHSKNFMRIGYKYKFSNEFSDIKDYDVCEDCMRNITDLIIDLKERRVDFNG